MRSLLAAAVKQEQHTYIQGLSLLQCNIADIDRDLGRNTRTSVGLLTVSHNPFTSSAVKRFLQYHYFSRLQELDIGRPLNQEEKVVYNQLQLYRRQCNLPPLTIINTTMKADSAALAATQDKRSLPKEVLERRKKHT